MALDRGALDQQLRDTGEGERWWEVREFRALPSILHPDERIAGLALGRVLGRRRPRLPLRSAPWLLVATDQRLICLREQRFARRQLEWTPGQILGATQGSRLRSFQISLDTSLGRYRLRIAREDAFRFAAALTPLLPRAAERRLPEALEAFRWLPGIDTVAHMPGVAGLASRIAALSPPDLALPAPRREGLEVVVERLQRDVDQLQQQVAFLEELMRRRAEERIGAGGGVGEE